MILISKPLIYIFSATVLMTSSLAVKASTPNQLLDYFKTQARDEKISLNEFSIQRGQLLFESKHIGGKPGTPSCISCHDLDPSKSGKTRAGKIILPMALSKNAERFTDTKKVEKWFGRNCRSVLGRECTVQEKGDFILFMVTQ